MLDRDRAELALLEKDLDRIQPEQGNMGRAFRSVMLGMCHGTEEDSPGLVSACGAAISGLKNFLYPKTNLTTETLEETVSGIDGPMKGLVDAAGRFIIKAQGKTAAPRQVIWAYVEDVANRVLLGQLAGTGYN